MTTIKRNKSKLESHLLETMFENALFSDLSLVFIHPSFPFSMRFNVHKSIISQSPYLRKLLQHWGSLKESELEYTEDKSLTIDLAKALTSCGFVLAPFQHIVRRQWQTSADNKRHRTQPLVSSHIRFVLKWFYCLDKQALFETLEDKDTLRVLSIAVLFDVHDLTQACIHRYSHQQLTLKNIMHDLETLCQFPRGHLAYIQLRDAALLLLLRLGPDHATELAMLPVDYMADVLSADLLFVENEFERYCLLRAVLMAFMQSVGKITWTPKGPVDQDAKRLSGYIRPLNNLNASAVRSKKRKRIPSEELEDRHLPKVETSKHLQRISFSARVPFEDLRADASSGGVIDKATVLSYLLRTTVNYSNMTFDQLTSVRQDGIVDESVVFRALWQREALERVLFPLTYHKQSQVAYPSEGSTSELDEDQSVALNEYFDVDYSDAQEKRRRLLLGTPRFRFRSSINISVPSEANGWECEEKTIATPRVIQGANMSAFDDDSDGSIWSSSDEDGASLRESSRSKKLLPETSSYTLFRKVFYSQVQDILGVSYRVQVEAQVMPRHRLYIDDGLDEFEDSDEESEAFYRDQHDPNENIMVCRFELQRDMKQINTSPVYIKKEKDTNTKKRLTSLEDPCQIPVSIEKTPSIKTRDKTKIHYWIYCLNRHEGTLEHDRIDPEDRALIAVTEQCEREDEGSDGMQPGYIGQILLDTDLTKDVTVDVTVALEIFGFQKV